MTKPTQESSRSSKRGRLALEAETVTVAARARVPVFAPGSAPPEPETLALDERFIDEGELGRGGMARVHRVFDKSIGRAVAMKVLPPSKAASGRQRFLMEAQLTGQLEHPNIVPVYELGADDEGILFFTMRLIEGRTFSEVLREQKPESDEEIERALEIFFRVCDALAFAHSRGVVHRDIKPSNIMVAEHGQVYLVDWGIALATDAEPMRETIRRAQGSRQKKATTLTMQAVEAPGTIVGTFAYMAPEQARGKIEDVDIQTDVFSLAGVLFRIAAGRPPFAAPNESEMYRRAMAADLGDVRVEGRLRSALLDVARQGLRADKAERFASVEALKRATQGVLRGGRRFPRTQVPPGEIIVREGTLGHEAYYIQSGQCLVSRVEAGAKVSLHTLGPGEVFGETAVFTGEPRNASVEAITDVELTVVPGRFLEDALGLDSWMGAFVRSLGTRFTERSRRVSALALKLQRAEVEREALLTLAGQDQAPLAGVRTRVADALGLQSDVVEIRLTESRLFRITDGRLRLVASR